MKNTRPKKLLLLACLSAASGWISVSQWTAQAADKASTPSRLSISLQFPKEISVGRLVLLKNDWKASGQSATGSPLAEAKGTVKILSGQSIMLLSNDCISERMNFFNSLPPNALACLALNGTSISDKDLAFVNHLTGLRRLELEDTDITDVGLVQLSKLNNLEYLCLSCTLIKGNTLGHLNVPHLRNLHIDNVALEPKAFREISKFKELRWLTVDRVHLTDSGLADLAQLSNLEGLVIANNPDLTDAGLRKLIGRKQLRRLDLANTHISLEGVLALEGISLKWLKLSSRFKSEPSFTKLKKAFPRAGIEFDQDRQRIPSEMFAPLH